eukprot:gene16848-34981_t
MFIIILFLGLLCVLPNEYHGLRNPTVENYLNLVYSVDSNASSAINIQKLDMVYQRQNLEIVVPKEFFHDSVKHISYIKSAEFKVYKDYEWAEVIRFATTCLFAFHHYEGYSIGLLSSAKNSSKIPYGCWFYRYRGSGIFVNVGKTIAARKRKELIVALGITGCELNPDVNCGKEVDQICLYALSQGYDSIQVNLYGGDHHRPELIICSGQCATVTFNTSCPPGVELRTGVNGSKPCTCDDSYMIMNCGKNAW